MMYNNKVKEKNLVGDNIDYESLLRRTEAVSSAGTACPSGGHRWRFYAAFGPGPQGNGAACYRF